MMKPQIHIGKMKELPSKRQARICKCAERCEEYILLIGNDDFILCKHEGMEHAYDILRALGFLVPKRTWAVNDMPEWTTKELKKVREYVLQHGSHDGMYEVLSMELGRSKAGIKKQVGRLRKAGELPPIKRG